MSVFALDCLRLMYVYLQRQKFVVISNLKMYCKIHIQFFFNSFFQIIKNSSVAFSARIYDYFTTLSSKIELDLTFRFSIAQYLIIVGIHL